MKLGMYTAELKKPTLEQLFESISEYGFKVVQWDFLSICDEEMPLTIERELIEQLKVVAQNFGIEYAALTGTFNMAHKNIEVRLNGLKRLETLASICHPLGCRLVTLCTGSRNDNMWTFHPDNATEEAWQDMMWTMREAVKIADKYDIILGIEIEASNVVNTAKKACRLFNELNSSRIGLIMDCANIFANGSYSPQEVRDTIKEVFDLLGNSIVLAHGKDLKKSDGIQFTYAGNGIVDFDYFIKKLKKYGYDGPMILHGMSNEKEYPKSVDFIKEKLIT